MKKRIAFILIIIVSLIAGVEMDAKTTRKSSSSKSKSSQSTKFPITVTAERLMLYGESSKLPLDTVLQPKESYKKSKYVITLNANGTYTGTLYETYRNWRTGYEWVDNDPIEFSGRWITTYRMMGTSRELVYDVHFEYGYLKGSIYIPSTFDYLYEGDWDACRNLNTKPVYVYQITNVKKG